ncbi:hypothetical protein D4S03_02790 [bacterium]|nr:MAG: hypothetical protein D4S03_02790 [bacterium]
MTLSDEMRRLSQDFSGAYDDRMAAVAGIRTATAQKLAEFHAAQQETAAELRARLNEQVLGRLAQATEDARGRAEYVDELRGDTAAFIKELDAAQQQMAAELRAHLDEQESGRRAQAVEDARGRDEYVDELRGDTATFLDKTHAANQQMAAELRTHLDEQESVRRAQAAEDVATLKSDTAAMLSEFQTEQSEARQVWSSITALMQQRRAGKPTAAPPPRPAVKKVVAPPPPVVEEGMAPDDLTVIRGIGVGMQRHLNEAGIYTYAQLAASTPKKLQRALGDVGRMAKVETWIAQARDLAG